MAVAVGQRCVVRIQITDINLRNAKDIKAIIVSPQGEEKCQDVSFDEVSGVVYVSVDVNSVGSWAMWLGVRFDKELFYTPAFVFAEVEGDAKPCDAPYIVDVEVAGESVSVTPPKVDVNAVTREEFEQLSKKVEAKVDKVEGKGLSTNDYTDADKAQVANIPTLATKNEVAQVRMAVQSKPDKEGYYPDMTVGKSDNLVGRGEATEEEFSFRPSAGDVSIEDGTARISAIKGNSVVWNQGNYKGVNGSSNGVSITKIENGILLLSGISNSSSIEISYTYRLISNHKYLHRTEIISMGEAEELSFGNLNESDARKKFLENGIFEKIVTRGNTFAISTIGFTNALGVDFTDVKCRYRIHDLTKMFGAGNEPATVEEYHQRKPMNIEDEFAYNEGEIIDMNVDSVKSVSDNAWNPEKRYARLLANTPYELTPHDIAGNWDAVYWCPNTQFKDEDTILYLPNDECVYTFPQDGYVRFEHADPEWDYYKVCVCIKHSYDKPHPQHQEEVKDLSFIGEEFPEGMRSISMKKDANNTNINADIYDEIRFNPTTNKWKAIKRIGVADLGSLDISYSAGTGCFFTTGNSKFFKPYGPILSSVYTFFRNGNPTTLPDMHISSSPYFNDGVLFMKNSAYTDVASFKQAMQEQGVKLYYELAEHSVEEIEGSENWNLDYLIWDFGTEEALASVPSAPFRADIIYQFNAVDRIRNNSDRIAELEAKITSLTQAMSAMQTTNMEE